MALVGALVALGSWHHHSVRRLILTVCISPWVKYLLRLAWIRVYYHLSTFMLPPVVAHISCDQGIQEWLLSYCTSVSYYLIWCEVESLQYGGRICIISFFVLSSWRWGRVLAKSFGFVLFRAKGCQVLTIQQGARQGTKLLKVEVSVSLHLFCACTFLNSSHRCTSTRMVCRFRGL